MSERANQRIAYCNARYVLPSAYTELVEGDIVAQNLRQLH